MLSFVPYKWECASELTVLSELHALRNYVSQGNSHSILMPFTKDKNTFPQTCYEQSRKTSHPPPPTPAPAREKMLATPRKRRNNKEKDPYAGGLMKGN